MPSARVILNRYRDIEGSHMPTGAESRAAVTAALIRAALTGRPAGLQSASIANRIGRSRATVARHLTALAATGTVVAEPDPHDGRSIRYRLTGKAT